MKIENKTVCVTGAGGFLGSHLCRRLLGVAAKVIALDNFTIGQREKLTGIERELEIVNADIREPDTLKSALERSEIVFHLAAIANPRTCQTDFNLAFDVNVKGTANVLSVCSKVERIVCISSMMVYGEPKYLPIDEKHPIDGRDPYSISKIMCEYLFKVYHHTQGIPFTIIRNTNGFGPGQSKDYLIPTLVFQGLTQKQIEIWDPRPIRDFLYVDDAVEAFLGVVESDAALNEVVNLGRGHGISTGELADLISKMLGVSWVDVKKSTQVSGKLVCDISKLQALTGWEPKVSLEEALKKTIEYWKELLPQARSK